jgi:hypothetical protein
MKAWLALKHTTGIRIQHTRGIKLRNVFDLQNEISEVPSANRQSIV